jgi:hypothetical protein
VSDGAPVVETLHHIDAEVGCEVGHGVWPAHRGNGVAVRHARLATN